jgi:trigger factor
MVHVTVDGQLVPEMHLHDPTLMQVGSNLDDFDAGLRGIKAGEEKTFEFTYPEDSEDEDLAGKKAVAEVQCVDVLRRTVPELNEEFATKAGFENLEALRARVKEMLQAQSDALADQEVNSALIEEVVRRATVHVPDEMLEREASERLAELIKAVERQGATLEDYLAAQKTDLTQLQAQLRDESQRTVTNTLVLLELARENQITISDKEVEEEVKRRAESEGVKTSQLRRVLNENGEIGQLRDRVFFRKISELLRSKAEIKESTAAKAAEPETKPTKGKKG